MHIVNPKDTHTHKERVIVKSQEKIYNGIPINTKLIQKREKEGNEQRTNRTSKVKKLMVDLMAP